MSYEEQVLEHLAKSLPGLPDDISLYLKRVPISDGTLVLAISMVDHVCKREANFKIQDKLEANEEPAIGALKAITDFRFRLFHSALKPTGISIEDYVSMFKPA